MKSQIRIEKLKNGETIQYRESGNSMSGIIEHRQLITCNPITDYSKIEKDDAVFCKVKGNYYTHLVHAVRKNTKGYEFLIGNAKGGTNGWTSQEKVYGKVTAVG